MSNFINIKELIKKGYGVAPGKSGDTRFPGGTIAMQKPSFYEQGINLSDYFSGTINFSIFPYKYKLINAKYTFKNIKWSANAPSENFSFLDCRILINLNRKFNGLIYYPYPETKPEHFQSPYVLEIITSSISGLKYGDEILLEVDSEQINIMKIHELV